MERQSYKDRSQRESDRDRDDDTRSTPLYDWESSRNESGYAYGGYPEGGFGPRETRRHYRDAGRERTERGHYSADRPRDYASSDRDRGYGARRYADYDYGERDDSEYGYRSGRRDNDDRDAHWTAIEYASLYGWPSYVPPYSGTDYGRGSYTRDYGQRGYPRGSRHERGFFERAGDEVRSWFGDEDAQRRREADHRGRGPTGYVRSDDRIREDVNDRLTDDYWVDASGISVTVSSGEVSLDGQVDSKIAKRRAEDLADAVTGVKHVQNNLRVDSNSFAPQGS